MKEVAPVIDFANAIVSSRMSMTVGEAARVLSFSGFSMGSQRLYKYFEAWGWVSKQGRGVSKLPLQYPVERGYLELKYQPQSNPTFPPNKKTFVTPKGLKRIFEKLTEEKQKMEVVS